MRRTFIYFAAFTGMGTLFALTMIMAALVLGAPSSETPEASAPTADGPIGEITITAFDLGFEPAMAHVAAPGTYTVTFVNDGGDLPRRDLRRRHGHRRRGPRDRHRRGDDPGRRDDVHLLRARPRGCRDDAARSWSLPPGLGRRRSRPRASR